MSNWNYKKLLSEKEFLKVAVRARQLMKDGTNLYAIYYKDKKLYFKTRSGTNPNIIWTQVVEISDATIENIMNGRKFKDIEELIKYSDLKIGCDCPAFLYWGFKYKAWKNGYGLEKEIRRPVIRNPYERGHVCFTGDMRVLTENGYKFISEVVVGDLVFTHKGRLRRVVEVSSNIAEKVLDIRYRSNHIKCTESHQFFAAKNFSKSRPSSKKFNKDLVSWISAEELKEGDFLLSPKLTLTHSISVGATKAFLVGLYAGDGSIQCVRSKTLLGSVCNDKYRVKGMYIALDSKYLNGYSNLFAKLGIPIEGFSIKDGTNSCSIRITDKSLRKICFDTCNFTCTEFGEEKKLDNSVLSWSETDQWELVRGFFLADGTVVKGSGKVDDPKTYFTLFNTNFDIMSKLLIILNQWYSLEMKWYDRKPFEEYGRMIYPKRMYYIRLTGKNAEDFSSHVWDLLQFKSQGNLLEFTKYQESSYNIQGTVYYPKIIKSITTSPGQVVYNLGVEEDDSYIVEGVAVHNCKHLHLVLQIYPFWAKALASKFKKYYSQQLSQNVPSSETSASSETSSFEEVENEEEENYEDLE